MIVHPINCTLISEEVKEIKIILEERNSSSLKGRLIKEKKTLGEFKTKKPYLEIPATWSFNYKNKKLKGETILFKNDLIWHIYQNKIKSHEVNRALFSELSTKISSLTNDKKLLKASSGFFKIGKGCYGGRIKKS